MARRRLTQDSGFRCGLYPAAWNPARVVTYRAASYRFELRVEGPGRPIVFNVNAPGEALRLARRFAGLMTVCVRDCSRRRGYLSETELEELARLESSADADHA